MPGRVFITGGSGFVGTAVIEELASRNYQINALLNRGQIKAGAGSVQPIKGSLFDGDVLQAGMRGCEAVIHLVGIIMEKPSRGLTFERIHVQGTQSVVEAAKRAGVKRYLHMSALGTRPDAVSNYHKTKYKAEEHVRASGLEWTIFRPSLIHGANGEFMKMEAKWATHLAPPFLFMPYFGAGALGTGGAGLLQPVYVGDVARGFVDALQKRTTVGEVYPMAGPDRFTWPQLHRTVSQAVAGSNGFSLAMPAWKAKLLARIGVGPMLGFNWDQVVMSQEDNTTDITKFVDHFGWEPKPFEATLRTYASQL